MNKAVCFLGLCIVCFYTSFAQQNTSKAKPVKLSDWALDALNIPILNVETDRPIVVAVIDDGFRLSHNALREYIHRNTNEIAENLLDDDFNGYVDDVHGWDISDDDKDVSIGKELEVSHYHGTFIASLICRVAEEAFGEEAPQRIQILPVKVLPDLARFTAIRDGYLGIKYAMDQGADIICCAWSGGTPSPEEKNIIATALKRNILLIASAGNNFQETVDFPASATGICAIAAVDSSLRKTSNSNYGEDIDLAFPGERVKSAYTNADNAWFYGKGTSAAAGLASGCAAVLKCIAPKALPGEIILSLKNTSLPLDSLNARYCGKLGAGFPNLSDACDYLQNPRDRDQFFSSLRPEGSIQIKSKFKQSSWHIKPFGSYKSVRIFPSAILRKDEKKEIRIYGYDSLYFEGPLMQLTQGFIVPGSSAHLQFATKKKRDLPSHLELNYYVETIDSSKLYCSGTHLIESNEGQISDNSGTSNYANNTTCEWHITAPSHEQITFSFSDFDTEAKVDFVWLFDGFSPNPDHIIAKFSGANIPPTVTSRTNKVLVWFVTDGKVSRQGWTLDFKGKPGSK